MNAEMQVGYAVFSSTLGAVELAMVLAAFLVFVKIVRGRAR